MSQPKTEQALQREIQQNTIALVDSLHQVVQLHRNRREWQSALEKIDLIIHLRPTDLVAHINRGQCLAKLNRFEEAIAAFTRATEINPNDGAAHDNLGSCLYKLNRFEEAIAAYIRASEINPNSHAAHNNLGMCLYKLNRFEEAIAALTRAIVLDSSHPKSYSYRAFCYGSLGQFEHAKADYVKVFELSKDDSLIKQCQALYKQLLVANYPMEIPMSNNDEDEVQICGGVDTGPRIVKREREPDVDLYDNQSSASLAPAQSFMPPPAATKRSKVTLDNSAANPPNPRQL